MGEDIQSWLTPGASCVLFSFLVFVEDIVASTKAYKPRGQPKEPRDHAKDTVTCDHDNIKCGQVRSILTERIIFVGFCMRLPLQC